MLIRHLWQLKTIVFLHWGIICAVLLVAIGVNVLAAVAAEVGICLLQ